jgi:hypothetical protein
LERIRLAEHKKISQKCDYALVACAFEIIAKDKPLNPLDHEQTK